MFKARLIPGIFNQSANNYHHLEHKNQRKQQLQHEELMKEEKTKKQELLK